MFFQFGRYLLISSSRAGGLPANLQGLWNDNNDPPWRSDYHSNINVEMNYWPAETTNLAECHVPFLEFIRSQSPVYARNSQGAFPKHRGWTLRTESNIFGASGWAWNVPGNCWYCHHLWEHFAFSGDTQYLRQFAYPVLKEVCQFWEDHLKALPDGTLLTPDGWSPEQGPNEPGVTYDQELIWDLFSNYIAAADVLGTDRAYSDKIAGMREKLLKPKIGKHGQLQEWREDIDDMSNHHRHCSHLWALYPGARFLRWPRPSLPGRPRYRSAPAATRAPAGAWRGRSISGLACWTVTTPTDSCVYYSGPWESRVPISVVAAASMSIYSTPIRRFRSTATSAPRPASPRCSCKVNWVKSTSCPRCRKPGPTVPSKGCGLAAVSR